MERKIGEIFEFGGEWYQCVEGTCRNCSFYYDTVCKNITTIGNCYYSSRTDHKFVIFKKLEKVGEPYEFDGHLFQSYRTFEVPIFTENYATVRELGNNSKISIEIKEDMEETKLNIKPFSLEAAKAGKPVCTRDGHKARIICFDYNGETGDYPIVALVHYNKENKCYERVLKYTSDGLFNKYGDCQHNDDLMMSSEKKEGWVNIVRGSNGSPHMGRGIFQSKEEAENATKAFSDNLIDTVKISWEE